MRRAVIGAGRKQSGIVRWVRRLGGERRELADRRRSPAARGFWLRTFSQVLQLRNGELDLELTRMAQATLDHPELGPRRFQRSELEAEFEQAKRLARIVDQLFWHRLLADCRDLEPAPLAQAIAARVGHSHRHPLYGSVRFTAEDLYARLPDVSSQRIELLHEELTRLLGPSRERRRDVRRSLEATGGSSPRQAAQLEPYEMALVRLGLAV